MAVNTGTLPLACIHRRKLAKLRIPMKNKNDVGSCLEALLGMKEICNAIS
jgi:hypothetical protein